MIHIIYEDEHIFVIDKPSGMTVNKSETTKDELTVQDWAENKLKISHRVEVSRGKKNEKFPSKADQSLVEKIDQGSDFYNRGGIVHRLDKETSGVLLIANTPDAFIELQRQFKERLVKKTYIALAHGNVVPQEGEINVPVGRLPWNRRQFGVIAGGREAITKYKVIKIVENDLSLLELYPETGRTHQIRVHLKYIGYPIFGDFLYAGRKTQRNDRKVLSRVFLHASGITIIHPVLKQSMSFESPLPSDLRTVLEKVSEK